MSEAFRLHQHLLRTRLDWFVRQAFETVQEGREFVPEPFLEALCHKLQTTVESLTGRLVVTIPPRHLKSFSASVCLPALMLGRNPECRIAVASYGEELAREHMRYFRQVVSAPWYRAAFPAFEIAQGADRFPSIATTRGGHLRAVTVGGAFTGFGADVIIADDLIKAQDANSLAVREAAMRFFEQTALTRFEDQRRARAIVIQQRLHVEDVPAQLIERGAFEHLDMPSIATRDQTFQCYNGKSWTWKAGELLSPTRFPQEVLDQLRTGMGGAAFSAQYLQQPLPPESEIVDFSRLHFVDQPFDPKSLRYVVRSVDVATGVEDRHDYSVITTWGYDGSRWCLMRVLRRRLAYPDLRAELFYDSNPKKADRTIIENCGAGIPLATELIRSGIRAEVFTPKGDKSERLWVSTGHLYSGHIVIPRSEPWFDALCRELRSFPQGHDDQVDSVTQFVGWLLLVSMSSIMQMKNHGRPSNPARRQAGW